MKAQEANLTGLGHCIFPISDVLEVTNELPTNEIEPVAEIVEKNVLTLATLLAPPPTEAIIPTTTPVLLIIDIPTTETPTLVHPPDTLHFVSLEATTDLVEIAPQLPILQIVEKETIENTTLLDATESSNVVNASSYDASTTTDVTTVITESIIESVSTPNWTNVVQPLPVEPPPPEPILTEDII